MREMLESGIINYGEEFNHSMQEGGWDLSKVDKNKMGESKATFVFGQMNEPPGARARVALSGLTIAEYFRDGDGEGKGKDVLFFVDNIFRFTQAGSEVSALLGRMPFCCRLSTNFSYRNGNHARTYYIDKKWINYFRASCLCACR